MAAAAHLPEGDAQKDPSLHPGGVLCTRHDPTLACASVNHLRIGTE